jgi:hypothetical protein
MRKSSRSIPDSDSNVCDDLSFESFSLRVAKLENVLCNQDKLLCRVFHENKKLILELENSFSEIASLRSMHDDMSAKPCENYKMIIVNYAYLWLVHTQVTSQLKGAKLELRELKAHSLLLALVVLYLDLIWRLMSLKLKILSTKLIIFLSTVLYPLCVNCVALSRVSFFILPKRMSR